MPPETSVGHSDPLIELLGSSKQPNNQYSDIRFGIHEQAYLIKGILDRIQKYEKMNPRSSDDEKAYQFNLKLLEKLEYCRNAALPE